MEQGTLPDKFTDAKAQIDNLEGANKDHLLEEVVSLVKTGRCDPAAMELLELFGYVKEGTICVPIYTPEHQKFIAEIENIVEKCLGNAVSNILIELAVSLDITAVRHGVDRKEIANELMRLQACLPYAGTHSALYKGQYGSVYFGCYTLLFIQDGELLCSSERKLFFQLQRACRL